MQLWNPKQLPASTLLKSTTNTINTFSLQTSLGSWRPKNNSQSSRVFFAWTPKQLSNPQFSFSPFAPKPKDLISIHDDDSFIPNSTKPPFNFCYWSTKWRGMYYSWSSTWERKGKKKKSNPNTNGICFAIHIIYKNCILKFLKLVSFP